MEFFQTVPASLMKLIWHWLSQMPLGLSPPWMSSVSCNLIQLLTSCKYLYHLYERGLEDQAGQQNNINTWLIRGPSQSSDEPGSPLTGLPLLFVLVYLSIYLSFFLSFFLSFLLSFFLPSSLSFFHSFSFFLSFFIFSFFLSFFIFSFFLSFFIFSFFLSFFVCLFVSFFVL